MRHVAKILEIATNIALVCTILSFLSLLLVLGVSAFTRIGETNDDKLLLDADAEWQTYTQSIVSGDTARYLLSKYNDECFIRIATDRQPYGFFGDVDYTTPESSCFIGLDDEFVVTTIYNDAGVPVGLNLVKTSVVDAAKMVTQYCSILDGQLAAYNSVILEMNRLTDSLRAVNGDAKGVYSQEAQVACRDYYNTLGKLKLYYKMEEVLR